MNIGKNIKQFRTSLNMSQDDLAQKLFVTRQTVSNYEIGKSQPTIETLQALATIFGCSMEDLLYGKKKEASINQWVMVLRVILGLVIFHSYLSKVTEEWTSTTYHLSAYAYLLVPIIHPLLFSAGTYAIVEILKAKQTKLPKVPYNKYMRSGILLGLGIYVAVMLVYPTAMAMDNLSFLAATSPYADFQVHHILNVPLFFRDFFTMVMVTLVRNPLLKFIYNGLFIGIGGYCSFSKK